MMISKKLAAIKTFRKSHKKISILVMVCLILITTFLAFTGYRGVLHARRVLVADTAAQKFSSAVEKFVFEDLLQAIIKGSQEDDAVKEKYSETRPAPSPSLDFEQTKEQRHAASAPRPLLYGVRLRYLDQLKIPTLEAIKNGDDISKKYAAALELSDELKSLHKEIRGIYLKSNVTRQVENDVKEYEAALRDLSESMPSGTVDTYRSLLEAQIAVTDKYYPKLINETTKEYLDLGYYRVINVVITEYNKHNKTILAAIQAGKVLSGTNMPDEVRAAMAGALNYRKEIGAIGLMFAIGEFQIKESSDISLLEDLAKEYFPEKYESSDAFCEISLERKVDCALRKEFE